jgi:carbonic anhydrase
MLSSFCYRLGSRASAYGGGGGATRVGCSMTFRALPRAFLSSSSSSKDSSNDPAIESLFIRNREWIKRTNEQDPSFFNKLGAGQSPEYLYIGCSDSRVAITQWTGLELGHLFVHRNIANLVVSADLNLLSVLTYAIAHLKVKHILIAGHYDCGGIRAAVQKRDYGPVLDAWLQNIRDVYRLHKSELDAIENDEERHRRLVELNVVEQCINLYKTSIVQSTRLQTFNDPNEPMTRPRIHALVFDPANGKLSKIPIDYRRAIDEIHDHYDLFETPERARIGARDRHDAEYILPKKTASSAWTQKK